ncbi:unnamed protein product, partial [Rotaria sordida]
KIFTNLGLDYEERVLASITNEILKSIVTQFDAIQLIIQRTLISQCVSELVTEYAAQFGLLLGVISITEKSRQANVIAAEGVACTADLIGKALEEAGDDKFSNVFHDLVLLLF